MSTLSNIFNLKSIGSFMLKTAFISLPLLILGGGIDMSLYHNHPIGHYLMEEWGEPILKALDGVADFIGRPDLMRNLDLRNDVTEQAAEQGCAPITNAFGMPECV